MKRSDLADLIIAENPDLRKDDANRLVRTIFTPSRSILLQVGGLSFVGLAVSTSRRVMHAALATPGQAKPSPSRRNLLSFSRQGRSCVIV